MAPSALITGPFYRQARILAEQQALHPERLA